MARVSGSKNFFDKNTLYTITEAYPYLQKEFDKAGLEPPHSWIAGGGLNEWAYKLGIKPDSDNGINGRGHQARYNGGTMYAFCRALIDHCKGKKQYKKRTPSKSAEKPINTDNVDKYKTLCALSQLLHERARIEAEIFKILISKGV